MIYGYDIEILPNLATFTFIPLPFPRLDEYIKADIEGRVRDANDILIKHGKQVYIVYENTNQLYLLAKFIKEKVQVLVSYNGNKYDNVILDFALYSQSLWSANGRLVTKELRKLSDSIIDYGGYNFRKDYDLAYCKEYKSIDLMSLHNLHKAPFLTSLKQVSIRLKWYKVMDYMSPPATEKDVELYAEHGMITTIERIDKQKSFDRLVLPEEIPAILEYNDNDVLILAALQKYSKAELQSRLDANKKYKIYSLSDSRSTLADKIMTILYSGTTGLNKWEFINKRTFRKIIDFGDIVSTDVYFETKELQAVLKKVQETVVFPLEDNRKPFTYSFVYEGCKYILGEGGLHSGDTPGIFTEDNNSELIDADVSSYYPAIIVQLGVRPAHLSSSFTTVVSEVRTDRMIAKAAGDKSTADILKIVINSGTFGKLGFKNSMLYDLQAMFTVTINGQLFLLMLAEAFQMNGIQVISANTDGLICRVPKDKSDTYYQVCKDWEEQLGYDLEYTKYTKYVRNNVNNYLAVTTNGQFKRKGDYGIGIDISKGYDAPVIALAVNEYFIKGTPVKEFIYNHTEIYNFCIAQKVGGQFDVHYYVIIGSEVIIENIQKNTRYYVSTTGGVLFKQYRDKPKKISLVAGRTVTIFNNYIDKGNISNYNIQYNYYVARATEFINKISNIVTKDMRVTSGKMFD